MISKEFRIIYVAQLPLLSQKCHQQKDLVTKIKKKMSSRSYDTNSVDYYNL